MQVVKQSLVGDYYIPSADVIVVCDVLRSTATQAAAISKGVERLYLFNSEIDYLKSRKIIGEKYPVFSFVEYYSENLRGSEPGTYKSQKSMTDVIRMDEPVRRFRISPTFIKSDEFEAEKIASFYGNWQTKILISAWEAAKTVIAAGLINAQAVIDFVKSKKPKKVCLIVVGEMEYGKIAPHNELFADYLQKAFEGNELDKDAFLTEMKETVAYLAEGVEEQVQKDVAYCMQIDDTDAIPMLNKVTMKKTDLIYLSTAK